MVIVTTVFTSLDFFILHSLNREAQTMFRGAERKLNEIKAGQSDAQIG